MELTGLKGVGEKTAASFEKLNINSVEDLILYFPRDYDYFGFARSLSSFETDRVCSVRGMVVTEVAMSYVRGKSLINFFVSDGTDKLRVTYFNAPYLKKTIKKGDEYIFRGVLRQKGSSYYMSQPKFYRPEEYETLENTLQPIYSVTKGLSNQTVRKIVAKALVAVPESTFEDPVPERFYLDQNMPDYKSAVYEMHFPAGKEELTGAARRLAYQELFLFAYQMGMLRSLDQEIMNHFPMVEVAEVSRMIEKLPYRLTEDQQSVWNEILADLTGEGTMNRLVQGDVGCGKTILAILALVTCVCNGYQGAFMAPTEVLATQHFDTLKQMIAEYELPVRPVLLTGSLTAAAKRGVYEQISSGEANLIIGTHALFQEKVSYKCLGLVITDEQHRFGVLQRQKLSEKGMDPHILVMSATPIPRTLALILYGQLRISTIHQMPSNRKPIKNCVVGEDFREKAYAFVEAEVIKGHQVYIICPMIEESEQPDLVNVQDYSAELRSRFGEKIRVGTLHGKMRPADKNRIMENFADGNIDVLVSTTVVEVGVNVPNATVMMVENAERFGLAQLHQLRGRVGRGSAQSFCIFLFHGNASDCSKRLKILERSNDGFEIANEDMRLRGPGDLFGIRQSGGMEFQIADIYRDSDLLIRADQDARALLCSEDESAQREREKLRIYLETCLQNQVDFRSI